MRVLLHFVEVEMQLSTVPPCQHILETIIPSISQSFSRSIGRSVCPSVKFCQKSCKQSKQQRFSPAKETLHVLEQGVRPLPGGQAPFPLVAAAHSAAADQIFQSAWAVCQTFSIFNQRQPLWDGIGDSRAGAGLETKSTALLALASSTSLPHPRSALVGPFDQILNLWLIHLIKY